MVRVSQFARRCGGLRRKENLPTRFDSMFHFRNIARKLIKPPGFTKVNSSSRANYGIGTAYAGCENYDESGCGGRCGQQVSSNGVFCPKLEFSPQVFLTIRFFQRTG